jgi:peroxiredoxin
MSPPILIAQICEQRIEYRCVPGEAGGARARRSGRGPSQKRFPPRFANTENETMAISTGTNAPDFTLKSKTGGEMKEVTLSDHFGKNNTVLLFFPLAFTGVCTAELCDVTQGIEAYKGLGAEVIGVSVDSPFAQEAWAARERIGVTLASDLNKETAKAYGVLLDDLAGLGSVAARAAFVIDREGVIRYAEQTPTPKDLPNFGAIKAVLATLN